ncbi:MAG: hypothetical protein ACMUJM_05250 [bacterium]
MNMLKGSRNFILIMMIIMALCLVCAGNASAQALTVPYWSIMPPYNVLWPLWSPGLSPIDPVTGLTTPLVSSVTRNTVLPVQPGLVWDPCQPVPYLLYNTPPTVGSGLLYYHEAYGLNPWPPAYMLDAITGAPAPIPLPQLTPFSPTYLSPYASGEWEYYVPIANIYYALTFGLSGQAFLDLLDPFDIWGPVLRTGVPTTPIIF